MARGVLKDRHATKNPDSKPKRLKILKKFYVQKSDKFSQKAIFFFQDMSNDFKMIAKLQDLLVERPL